MPMLEGALVPTSSFSGCDGAFFTGLSGIGEADLCAEPNWTDYMKKLI